MRPATSTSSRPWPASSDVSMSRSAEWESLMAKGHVLDTLARSRVGLPLSPNHPQKDLPKIAPPMSSDSRKACSAVEYEGRNSQRLKAVTSLTVSIASAARQSTGASSSIDYRQRPARLTQARRRRTLAPVRDCERPGPKRESPGGPGLSAWRMPGPRFGGHRSQQGQRCSCLVSDKNRILVGDFQLARDMTLRHRITSFRLVEHETRMTRFRRAVSPLFQLNGVRRSIFRLDLQTESQHMGRSRPMTAGTMAA